MKNNGWLAVAGVGYKNYLSVDSLYNYHTRFLVNFRFGTYTLPRLSSPREGALVVPRSSDQKVPALHDYVNEDLR